MALNEPAVPEALPLVAQPDLPSQVRAVQEDGYVFLPTVLDADQTAELRAHMDRLQPNPDSFDRGLNRKRDGFINRHINNAFNRDPHFVRFLDYPGVIEVAEALHGANCHVIGMTAWMTGPGRPDQSLHADWQPLTLPEDVMADPRVSIPVYISTAHFYLDDLTEELGPTRFVPGSHRAGRAPGGDTNWNGHGEQSILCAAGDVVIFRSEVWHRGTANHSDRVRYLLQVHYAQRWISQRFPPYLHRFQFDPEIVAIATERQRRLLGDHPSGNYD